MEVLRRERSALKSGMTRIQTATQNQDISLAELKVRVVRLEQLFKEFERVQSQIEALADETEFETESNYRVDIEEKYFAIKLIFENRERENVNDRTISGDAAASDPDLSVAIHALMDHQSNISRLLEGMVASNNRGQSTPANINTPEPGRQEFRLPQIQIPEFDGTYINWIRFRDLFEAMIHTRAGLANVEKFEYLQSKLKGDALALIKHLKPTNDNYTVAWDILKKRFERPDKVKKAYFEILFNQVNMKAATASELKRVLGNVNEGFNALKALAEPVNHWDSILLFFLEKKLDSETLTLWYRSRKPGNEVKFSEFIEFLEARLFELENAQDKGKQGYSNTPKNHASSYAAGIAACPLCTQNHFLFNCENFKKLSVNERIKTVKDLKFCFNCLRGNHFAEQCNGSLCRICNAKHNSLLHRPNNANVEGIHQSLISENSTQETETICNHSTNHVNNSVTILPTAIVMILDNNNIPKPCRALLDSGSQATLVTTACVQRLNLRVARDKTLLHGVSSNNGTPTKGKVHLRIHVESNKIISSEAFCLTKLTQNIPAYKISGNQLDFFKCLKLADPQLHIPQSIDIIIGADIFSECFLNTQHVHPSGSPTAIETIFGWVLVGKISTFETPNITVAHTYIDMSDQLQKFWEIENVNDSKIHLTPDEDLAEQHYQQHVTRGVDGRYIVRLPFRDSNYEFGDSRSAASKRLKQMQSKFKTSSKLETDYKHFMKEFIDLGHMEVVEDDNIDHSKTYFMPHHAVLKPSSTTTKLRVVFDASCKSSNGRSLNDQLLVGPTIQSNLFSILVQFRKYSVAFAADIEKMYRQVQVHPADRAVQQILWHDDNNQHPKAYCLKTVTYGTASAPFLATRTLFQVAIDNADNFSKASELIKNCFYVDDLMSCAQDVQSAVKLQLECRQILSAAGFHLRKWCSNSSHFIEHIDQIDRESSTETVIDDTQTVKTLGLLWDTKDDSFKYAVNLTEILGVVTKRMVLSDICKIFDPLGWLSPVVVALKIFMQSLWLKGIDWDQPLTDDLLDQWHDLRNHICLISKVRIPRWLQYNNEYHFELHGFADASELAYSAAIYLKVLMPDGSIAVNLIAAKTRVAPVKQISIPRLELCAAQLMTKLLVNVQTSLNFSNCYVFGHTDSTIVLAWISDHPKRWKTFIANRTSYIINILPASQWSHIASQQNPADLATRGIAAEQLVDNELWWHGPSIIRQIPFQQMIPTLLTNDRELEERKITLSHVLTKTDTDFLNRYSSYNRLIRITALLFRFVRNCKVNKADRTFEFLTSVELSKARQALVKISQLESFPSEISIITKGKPLPNTHKLIPLAPFIDNYGLLRVGGRVENANIPYSQKHPLILHRNSYLTELIVRDIHVKNLHAGSRHTEYVLGLEFWVPSATFIIKRVIYKCAKCMRYRNRPFQQQMGNIPKCRFETVSAFINTGIDFAGPIQIKSWKGRVSKLYKCWIAVFVCLTTKAIHLELVTELSTAAFVASLRRFVSRRGKPLRIYSDNGTNFVGCNQYLRELTQFLSNSSTQERIVNDLVDTNIEWHFSPPSGPHFGGMFEAGVKSVKFHLKRVLQTSTATFEEMSTILCQIEACLNSRPLCLKFSGDSDPLTPAHFLIFRPMHSVPDEDLLQIPTNRLSRWQYLQQLVQQFWRKWSKEYITQLQRRTKWSERSQNVKIDDIVLVKEDNLPPSQWNIARIVETYPGTDGLVRVVSIKTSKGTYKRPIVKLCPLFIDI